MGCAASGNATEKPLADLGHGKKGGKRGPKAKGAGGRRRTVNPQPRKDERGESSSIVSDPTAPRTRSGQGATNPLNAVKPRPPAGAARVESDEQSERQTVVGAERRQRDMLVHDEAHDRSACAISPSASRMTSVGIPGSSFTVDFGDDDDFDDRPRRSTMNHKEYKDASKMRGKTAVMASKASSQKQANVPRLSEAGVKSHTSERDCWVIVRGEVYDMSDFLDDHPGGAYAILQHAGTDATKAFEAAHPPGIRPWSELSKYHVGKVDTSAGRLTQTVAAAAEEAAEVDMFGDFGD